MAAIPKIDFGVSLCHFHTMEYINNQAKFLPPPPTSNFPHFKHPNCISQKCFLAQREQEILLLFSIV